MGRRRVPWFGMTRIRFVALATVTFGLISATAVACGDDASSPAVAVADDAGAEALQSEAEASDASSNQSDVSSPIDAGSDTLADASVVDASASGTDLVTLGCDIAASACTLPVYNQVRVAFPSVDAFVVAALPLADAGTSHKLRIYSSTDRGQTARVFPQAGAAAPLGLAVAPNADWFAVTIASSGSEIVAVTVLSTPNEAGTARDDVTHILQSSDNGEHWRLVGGSLPIQSCYFHSVVPNPAGGFLLGGRCLAGASWSWIVARTNATFTSYDVLDEQAGGTPSYNISFVDQVLVASDGCVYAGGGVFDGLRKAVVRRSCAGGAWVDDYRLSSPHGSIRNLAEQSGTIFAFAELAPAEAGAPNAQTALLQRTGPLSWTSTQLTTDSLKKPAFLQAGGAACRLVYGTAAIGATHELDLRRTNDCGGSSISFGTSSQYFVEARAFGNTLRVAELDSDLQLRSVVIPP